MGSVHSEPNQAGCIAWQNSNPTKECTWSEGCIEYWIPKKGEQPVSEDMCNGNVGSSDPPSPRGRSRPKCNNNHTLILIGVGLLLLALICARKR